MKIILGILLLIPTTLVAKEIELNLSYSWTKDGMSTESSTKVKAHLGKAWKIPLQALPGHFLKMTATEVVDTEKIHLKSEISEVIKGKEKIIYRPEILTTIGKETTFETGNLEGTEHFKLSVTATKAK